MRLKNFVNKLNKMTVSLFLGVFISSCGGSESTGSINKYYLDADEDGYGYLNDYIEATNLPKGYALHPTDCDDTNPFVNPSSIETNDGIDNNCDGNIDEGFPEITFYLDNDNDSFGTTQAIVNQTFKPEGYVENSTDCDDDNNLVNPNASEIYDGLDNNCNDSIDEGFFVYYLDQDNDSFGDSSSSITDLSLPEGYVLNATDCDDTNPIVNPSSIETNDGIDNNCDGNIDEGFPEITFYLDKDNDSFGTTQAFVNQTFKPEGYVENSTDCDDDNNLVNPNASEIYDGVDNNCNDSIDEGFFVYYLDQDNDSFGDSSSSITDLSLPEGYVLNATDCDDNNSLINPASTEIIDGLDNNCDGRIDDVVSYNFVTSQFYSGDLGGVSGANSICQNHADSSARVSGNYKAYLRYPEGNDYGFDTISIIGNTTGRIPHPRVYDENREEVSWGSAIWSGFDEWNNSSRSCNDWTFDSADDSNVRGGVMIVGGVSMRTGGYRDISCNSNHVRLLCINQDN